MNEITRFLWSIAKGIIIVILALALFLGAKFLLDKATKIHDYTPEAGRPGLDYSGRMKKVEDSDIWIDTYTGVCYLWDDKTVCVMVTKDGLPYIANGWRDED